MGIKGEKTRVRSFTGDDIFKLIITVYDLLLTDRTVALLYGGLIFSEVRNRVYGGGSNKCFLINPCK